MRQALAALAAIVVPIAASAQSQAPITATPLLPPTVQYPAQQPGQTAPPGAPQAAAPTSPPQPAQTAWLPQTTAMLQVLDKVNAQNAVLTVKVGQSAQFGSLTIQVQACQIRPPDQPQDATAYLTITDSHADAPGFRGWMLANSPSVSMLQHPLYDVRVMGCRA
jgi:hypothetical protein